jgi:hypothetical protein
LSQGKSVDASQINPKMPSSSMPSLLYFSTVKEQKRVRDARKGQTTINSVDNIPWLACGRSKEQKRVIEAGAKAQTTISSVVYSPWLPYGGRQPENQPSSTFPK